MRRRERTRSKRLPSFAGWGWLLAVHLFASGWIFSQDQTQVIECRPGWNLISLQVGDSPILFADFLAGFDDPEKLIEIWGYHPTGDPSSPGQWETRQPNVPGFPEGDFTVVRQGRGYWVNVTSFATITLTGPAWDGSLSLVTGWNLVGFPGLADSGSEEQSLSAVFGTLYDRVPQVWTFDAEAQRFLGHDVTSIPTVSELTSVESGSGYWVYALENMDLTAGPYLALVQDADASPLQPQEPFIANDFPGLSNAAEFVGKTIRKPGAEDADYDLNGNGIIDNPFTQDTLHFDVGVDRKVISIGNTGTSIVNWSIDNSIPWLFVEPFDSKDPTNANRARNLSGIASTDRDTIVLYVDRRGLAPDRYEGQSFDVTYGDLQKNVKVILDVSTAAGDWKGYASAKRVNGKNIPLGKIDLGLNLFMNSENVSETQFRAVLNRDESLLFPRDVFMNGIFFQGAEFSLTTTFVMSPGDRNAPPYDTFSHSTDPDPKLNAQGDKDYDGDGVLDVMNPFPHAIQREVTLIGERVAPGRVEGTYVESIGGMLPGGQNVFIEGTFQLDRETLEPTRRSIFNQDVQPNLPIGGSSGQPFRESIITVNDAVNIQNVEFSLGIDFQKPEDLIITLTGPDGTVVTIHRNGETLAANSVIDLDQFNGKLGQGDWTLRVEWNPASGERGYLSDWGIDIQGLATYEVSGRITGDTGGGAVPLEGAQLVLSGSNVIEQFTTGADGIFSFSSLTENGYTLSVSRPGFESEDISFLLSNEDVAFGDIVLGPLTVAAPELQASPFIGVAPLQTTFALLIPYDTLNDDIGANATTTWNFGDGSAPVADSDASDDDISLTGAKHQYTEAGYYTATATLSGDGPGSPVVVQANVLVQRVEADPDGGTHQIIGVSYIGSMASPLSDAGSVVQVSNPATIPSYDITNDGNPSLTNIEAAEVYQESKRDVAAYDTDRHPKAPDPFDPNGEDTDFFTQEGTLFHDQSPEAADGVYSTYDQPEVGGQIFPDRYRMITTLGGYVFGTELSRSGDFELQGGRIEP